VVDSYEFLIFPDSQKIAGMIKLVLDLLI
jgi:hypothetical protein